MQPGDLLGSGTISGPVIISFIVNRLILVALYMGIYCYLHQDYFPW